MSESDAPVPRGDEDALYRRHADRLRQLLGGVVQSASPDQLDDACANAWMILLRTQPDRETVFPWLVTVAKHEAWRLQAADRRHAPLTDAPVEVPGAASEPERPLLARERLRAVAACLPERKRRIVALRALGYRYVEIAEITGDTPRTVDRQLTRAYRLLDRLRVPLGT